MKALILAAGYGTRLYPLTQSMPKPLLDVNGKPMMEYVLERIKAVPNINEFYVVGNGKFNAKFKEWKEKQGSHEPIKLLNDGTTDDNNKLGAIRDIELVL
ncbi:MAG: NTP transferase domain-containing protein, partial [Candidatus Omnitrophica bacterium]|nr:NTP transferase domain-containing protein [Candidatus Omnitrophota bacterium]